MKPILNNKEIQNLSKLLLSSDSNNIEIAFQILQQYPESINIVTKEVVLISQLSWNDELREESLKLLSIAFSEEQLAYWNEAFQIFHLYENLYDYSDYEENWHWFEKHEKERLLFLPLIIQNNDYTAEYIAIAECLTSYYKKKLDWAERYYQMALLYNPKDLNLLSTLADLYKDGFHDYDKAMTYYNDMLAIDPIHYDALEAKGVLLFSYLKQHNKAIEVLEFALKYYPKDQNLEIWLADIYMTKNSPELFAKGKLMLLDILKKTPKNTFALTIYANQIWITENKPHEAKELYLKGLKISNQSNSIFFGNLAELHYVEFKDFEQAKDYYIKSFALYMDDVFHLCNFISLLVLEMQEFNDAIDYYDHLQTLCYNGVKREPEMSDAQWRAFQEAEKTLVNYKNKES